VYEVGRFTPFHWATLFVVNPVPVMAIEVLGDPTTMLFGLTAVMTGVTGGTVMLR
jgi:hypothetical protein